MAEKSVLPKKLDVHKISSEVSEKSLVSVPRSVRSDCQNTTGRRMGSRKLRTSNIVPIRCFSSEESETDSDRSFEPFSNDKPMDTNPIGRSETKGFGPNPKVTRSEFGGISKDLDVGNDFGYVPKYSRRRVRNIIEETMKNLCEDAIRPRSFNESDEDIVSGTSTVSREETCPAFDGFAGMTKKPNVNMPQNKINKKHKYFK